MKTRERNTAAGRKVTFGRLKVGGVRHLYFIDEGGPDHIGDVFVVKHEGRRLFEAVGHFRDLSEPFGFWDSSRDALASIEDALLTDIDSYLLKRLAEGGLRSSVTTFRDESNG